MRSHSVTTMLFAAVLVAAISELTIPMGAQLFSSSSSSTSSSSITTTSVIKLRPNKIRRPESCRENLPRKSEDLPVLVVTARVKEVYLVGDGANGSTTTNIGGGLMPPSPPQQANTAESYSMSSLNQNTNKALVNIERVIKGNKQLTGADIIVSGFNSSNSSPCPNFVIPNDTLIFLLNHENNKQYSIQGTNLLSMNLNNLDRINAIAADETYKRRPAIEDILCEVHYCAYGRCVVNDRNQTSCQCPESCPPLPSPVCGSDNSTYTNECHLIKEGCRRQRPLFVTKESVC